MIYRGFTRPRLGEGATSGDWLEWMNHQDDLLLAVAPQHGHSCGSCFGAVGYRDGGPETWATCFNCRHYNGAVDQFIPITYSVESGLESMLHRYKDFAGHGWLEVPLRSLLHEFVGFHADCIDAAAPNRRIDVATIVPSDNAARTFSPLGRLLADVVGHPILNTWDWDLEFLTRNRATARPARGELRRNAYKVVPGVVDGAAVLLLDDTWTSGASAASAAAGLKAAGAHHVTVLTLGRQLSLSGTFGSTVELYEHTREKPWDLDVCVMCG